VTLVDSTPSIEDKVLSDAAGDVVGQLFDVGRDVGVVIRDVDVCCEVTPVVNVDGFSTLVSLVDVG
jgi:hypothetical protein